jgi:hypothetical protein
MKSPNKLNAKTAKSAKAQGEDAFYVNAETHNKSGPRAQEKPARVSEGKVGGESAVVRRERVFVDGQGAESESGVKPPHSKALAARASSADGAPTRSGQNKKQPMAQAVQTVGAKLDDAPALNISPLAPSAAILAKPEIPARLDTSIEQRPLINFRPYQWEPFANRTNGIEVWCWSRQIGKSFTLAAWAVDRLLTRPGRLVTILSNSQANGQELNMKVAEVCESLGLALKGGLNAKSAKTAKAQGEGALGEYEQFDFSDSIQFENMKLETHITVGGKKGRIRVLAASPRTARGFSGDLILDEFAFHENSKAIWEAAEPIISSNPDFLCRIASRPTASTTCFTGSAMTRPWCCGRSRAVWPTSRG